MREYEFRGRDKYGKWYYGSLLINDHRTAQRDIFDSQYYIYTTIGAFLVEPETVGQYTDIKDKNGKKIYEGDIVKAIDIWLCPPDCGGPEYDKTEIFIKQVVFEDNMFCTGVIENVLNLKNIEVIGNIHDNPELLEKTGGTDNA